MKGARNVWCLRPSTAPKSLLKQTVFSLVVCSHDVNSHYQKHEVIKRFMGLKLIESCWFVLWTSFDLKCIAFWKCTWHVLRALPEQCFQLLKHASPVHHGSTVCSVRVTVPCVCFCWVINIIYVTHENEDLAVRMTQLDVLVLLVHSHALLHCCLFLLVHVVHKRCSDVVGWCFACLRKDITTCCLLFNWINHGIMWEIEKIKMKKKQHNLLYKCINLDAPVISFQSHSAALKKMDLVSPDHPMHLKN